MYNNNWTEKIKQGMELIANGCDENGAWNECEKCPFDEYCSVLERSKQVKAPYDWNDNKGDKE